MKKIVLILYFVSIINVYLLFGMLIKFSLINLELLKFLVVEYKNINFFYTLLVLSFVLLIFMIFFLIYLLLKRKRYKEHFSKKISILLISNFLITTSIFLILFFPVFLLPWAPVYLALIGNNYKFILLYCNI